MFKNKKDSSLEFPKVGLWDIPPQNKVSWIQLEFHAVFKQQSASVCAQ